MPVWNPSSHSTAFGWVSRAIRISWSQPLVHVKSSPYMVFVLIEPFCYFFLQACGAWPGMRHCHSHRWRNHCCDKVVLWDFEIRRGAKWCHWTCGRAVRKVQAIGFWEEKCGHRAFRRKRGSQIWGSLEPSIKPNIGYVVFPFRLLCVQFAFANGINRLP